MFNRRTVIATVIVGVLAFTGGLANPAAARDEGDVQGAQARDFIEGLAEQAIDALTREGASREDKIQRFSELLSNNFDVETIAKWVLGRYWRGASDAEKAEYLGLFEDYVVITYVERFDQYTGEKLHVTRAVAEPGQDALVFSEIHRPTGGEPIRVDWRVRSEADNYKIIDVYVEGISMSQTQRKEFTSVIRSSGGTVSGLNEALRNQIAKLSN